MTFDVKRKKDRTTVEKGLLMDAMGGFTKAAMPRKKKKSKKLLFS
jgi:hypothetical protein